MKKRNYKIKSENGKVTYAMRTGKVFVKSVMYLVYANKIVKKGSNVEVSDKRGYGKEICVDETYFFPIEEKDEAIDEVTDNE